MAQKRKSGQTKLAAAKALLDKIEQKTARDVKKRLGENWRDNLFEIVMTRMDFGAPHKEALAGIPAALTQDPQEAPAFARRFFETMQRILTLAGAPTAPHHVAAFGALYASVIHTFLEDETRDHAKTMAALDKRLGIFERFAEFSCCP